ncbi:MAG: chromate transporter [Oscillospiraceae bacterium]|nr:chromate transporter [Oscillospiraceae bacterium]
MDKEKTNSEKKPLLKLFFTMLYISAFTFGGGFVIVTLMKKKFVDEYKWIDDDEMLDLTAIAQSSPGAIAVNAAILVGYKIGGLLGTAVAVIATIIPPIAILSVISLFYAAFSQNIYVATVLKGMQAGVAAVIFDVVCDLFLKILKQKSALHIIIAVAAFTAVFFFNVNVIAVIAAAALLGATVALIKVKKECKK